MADLQQLALLQAGVDIWNHWRRDNPLTSIDLRDVVLRETDLSKANFEAADLLRADLLTSTLRGANLARADLRAAYLKGANLNDADLSGANLIGADLNGAKLVGTNLAGARLDAANFVWADMRGANLSKTRLQETILCDTNLTSSLGLDTCQHFGPSVLDHRTLARSGTLPLTFLRGCGLPDKLIQYLPSLLNEAVQFYSCFISYSTKDEAFAQRLHADLQDNGVRCWFARQDIRGGRKIHEQIDDAIRVHDRLLLVLSEHSMNSQWVQTEIAKARQRGIHEKRRVLFPVRLVHMDTVREWECFDADTGNDAAREIREYFIPDFSDWKNHNAYLNAFKRLLQDLKSE